MSQTQGERHRFDEPELRGVYRAIHERRDIRSTFLPEPVADEVLARLLEAAHHAPSVGLMQPWSFIIIRELEARRAVCDAFVRANQAASSGYEDDRRALYTSMKLAAILETPLNVCFACDPTTARGHGLGRRTMPETVLYSTVCAVQNFWLAARAEGIGVGWVSIFNPDELRGLLGMPAHIVPVAYLCVGHVSGFDSQPELERRGWERRTELSRLVHFERYGETDERRATALLNQNATIETRVTT